MDIQLEANKNSALFSVLAKMDPFNPYIHKNKPSTINLRKQIVRVLPDNISTLDWGSTIKFSIPRWGLLADAHLMVDIQGDPTQVAGHLFGLNMMQTIKITSKSRTLFQGTPEYLMGRFCELPEDQRRLLEAAVSLPSEFSKYVETVAARGLSGPLGKWSFGNDNTYDDVNQGRNNGLPHITESLGTQVVASYRPAQLIQEMDVRATTGGAKHHRRDKYTYDNTHAKTQTSTSASRNRIMIPFFPPFAENMIQALDVNFCEEIQVECTPRRAKELFATQSTDPFVSFTSGTQASTCQFADNGQFKRRPANDAIWNDRAHYGIKAAELVVTYIQLTGEDWAQMRAAMFKEGSGYTQLTYETRSETQRQFTKQQGGYSMFHNAKPDDWGKSSNYLDVPLNVNNLAYCTKFMVRRSHEVLVNEQAPTCQRFSFGTESLDASATPGITNTKWNSQNIKNNVKGIWAGTPSQAGVAANFDTSIVFELEDPTTNTINAVAPDDTIIPTSTNEVLKMLPLDQHVYEEQGDAGADNKTIECQKRYTSTLQVGYFQLLASGQILYEQSGDANLLLNKTCPSYSTGTKRRDLSKGEPDMTPDIYTIWYGCKHERTAYSGSLSLQNLNNPTLRIWLKGGLTNTATGKTYGDLAECLTDTVLVTADTTGDQSTFSAHPGLSTQANLKGVVPGSNDYFNVQAGCDKLKGPWFDRSKGVAPCFGQGAHWNDFLPVSGGTASAMAIDKGTIGRYVEAPTGDTFLYHGNCEQVEATANQLESAVNAASQMIYLPPVESTIWQHGTTLRNGGDSATVPPTAPAIVRGGHPNRLRFVSDEGGCGVSPETGEITSAVPSTIYGPQGQVANGTFGNVAQIYAGGTANADPNNPDPNIARDTQGGNGTCATTRFMSSATDQNNYVISNGARQFIDEGTIHQADISKHKGPKNGCAIYQDLCLNGIGFVPGNTGNFSCTQAEPDSGPRALRANFLALQAMIAQKGDRLYVEDKGYKAGQPTVWGANNLAGDYTKHIVQQETTNMHEFVGAPSASSNELVAKTDIGRYLQNADEVGVVVDVWHENFSLQMINSGNGVITVAYGQ